MKARVYVRMAKRPNWATGKPYKIAASHNRDDKPLMQGDATLRTLHFAVDVEVPDELFRDPAMPVVEIKVEPDGTFRQDPIVVQVPLDVPAEEREGSAA